MPVEFIRCVCGVEIPLHPLEIKLHTKIDKLKEKNTKLRALVERGANLCDEKGECNVIVPAFVHDCKEALKCD
jgi:hypothetical protein